MSIAVPTIACLHLVVTTQERIEHGFVVVSVSYPGDSDLKLMMAI